MKPEDNHKIRNFKERNKYIEGLQCMAGWGALFTFAGYINATSKRK